MTLTSSSAPATAGEPVTLTATVLAADGTHPAGSVRFEVGGTVVGSPVPVNASGVAITTTTFGSSGPESVTAVFMPTRAKYKPSTGTLSLMVSQGRPESGMIPLAVNVPPTGAFTVTVDTVDTVTLTVSGSTATAATTSIIVSDTRSAYPGWSVSGQDTTWRGSGTADGSTIPGDQLGWTPTGSDPVPQGVTLGSQVIPASPGLGSAPAVLAFVHSGNGNGYGTATLGASLLLVIPVTQQAGPYAGSLSISVVATNP
jgi:hypothetical protein